MPEDPRKPREPKRGRKPHSSNITSCGPVGGERAPRAAIILRTCRAKQPAKAPELENNTVKGILFED